ncbi:GMC family oxidoreductase N-terminal domain-containing protein [Shewanella surugensis]|uniref:GMC family oxidoreductase n=1 Tax=Shewanella surugensis TaxID=212020 RepID=A0ABT0LHP4_9GAMM|nr:GMC family oxidoreductase [Shewanella surugensis]MCL1127214.1 GMC family oxidoreductase [Shewanella surugensis]
MQESYDFAIIGSGPSGSVLAHYLTQAGAQCVMLEAGKALDKRTYPKNELHANSQLMWNGGMDTSQDAQLLFLRGKVLGGGSVINQCLLDRFDALALEDWQAKSTVDWHQLADFERHYNEVESHLCLHHFTDDEHQRNAQLFMQGLDQCGMKWTRLRRGQNNCGHNAKTGQRNDCMQCLNGCVRDAKQSMPVTFLRKARQQGLALLTEFNVTQVIHGQHFVTVFGEQQGQPRQIRARHCIMAAGAIGSTELLLKSGFSSSLPALGQGFTCHPQLMNIGLFDEPVDAHLGTFQSVKSDEPQFRQQGFKLENVFAGPIAIAMLKPGFGQEHQDFMQKYRHMACIEVAVRDATEGQIRLNNKGELVIDKRLQPADLQRAQAGLNAVERVFDAVGAQSVLKSPFSFGLHLMGGCTMGEGVHNSVVNSDFGVWGYDRLSIADSSIFPNAPGINPSLTIMAMAHRASEVLLAKYPCRSQYTRHIPAQDRSDLVLESVTETKTVVLKSAAEKSTLANASAKKMKLKSEGNKVTTEV